MVAWPAVCRPKELGGLGIPDIRLTNIALQTRWLWLRDTNDQRAWSDLPLSVSTEVHVFFETSTYTAIGNGKRTAFLTGRWIQGQAIKDLAPTLTSFISRRNVCRTSIADGLHNRSWVRQISGGVTVPAI